MGLIKFLDKALAIYQKNLPDILEFVEKVEERQMRSYEKEQENLEKIETYKKQYSSLNNQELKERLNIETGIRKKAISLLLQERNMQVVSYKDLYSEIDTFSLKVELKMLEQRTTHYGEMQGCKLTAKDADVRKKIVKTILRERGEL